MTFWIGRDGQQFGPYSRDEVQQYLNQGRLLQTDLACRVGDQRWVGLREVMAAPPAIPSVQSIPPPFVPQPTASVHPQNQNIEEALALFVGNKYEAYFKPRWAKLAAGQDSVSWNWAGFFLGMFWVAYRKMYRDTFEYVGAISFIITVNVVWPEAHFLFSFPLLIPLYIGLRGNDMYRKYAKKRVDRIRATTSPADVTGELARKGGTSIGAAIWLFVALVFLVPTVVHLSLISAPFLRSIWDALN